MVRDVHTLAPHDTLGTALDRVLEGFQQDFPVVESGKVVGVLTRAGLLAALTREGRGTSVATSMETAFLTASPNEPAEEAVARLRACRCHTLPVISGGQLRGVLTLENVGEFVMIEAALRTASGGTASSSSKSR
jgi:CBS-domain-containing membrane protein